MASDIDLAALRLESRALVAERDLTALRAHVDDVIARCEAERDRYREALELIAAEDYDGEGNYARIALAALDGEATA